MTVLTKISIILKIVKCDNPQKWYASMIGKEIKAYKYPLSPYAYCEESDRMLDMSDCEIIN